MRRSTVVLVILCLSLLATSNVLAINGQVYSYLSSTESDSWSEPTFTASAGDYACASIIYEYPEAKIGGNGQDSDVALNQVSFIEVGEEWSDPVTLRITLTEYDDPGYYDDTHFYNDLEIHNLSIQHSLLRVQGTSGYGTLTFKSIW
ncbi:hypothetical protein KQI63_13400 [bacterium]|nr:hypothetical protein [bacterium]